jgi:hypothetical protein
MNYYDIISVEDNYLEEVSVKVPLISRFCKVSSLKAYIYINRFHLLLTIYLYLLYNKEKNNKQEKKIHAWNA